MGRHSLKKKLLNRKRSKQKRMQKIRLNLVRCSPFCTYCNKRVTYQTSTLDHIIPVSKGGRTTKQNLVLSCAVCNRQKSNKTTAEFREFMRKRDDTNRQRLPGTSSTETTSAPTATTEGEAS